MASSSAENVGLEPGPLDARVLYEQDSHISIKIWKTNEASTMKNTSCKSKQQNTLEPNTVSVSKPACFDDLPEDIVDDILVRLPARTLVRFKSVCKLWLNLISNPKFIKTHLLNSCNNHHRLIVVHRQYVPYYLNSLPINFDDESDVGVLNYPTRNPFNRIKIVGTCNGLVCIAIDRVGVFLWNPCTRISRTLPSLGHDIVGRRKYGFGFGYDQFSDDYKVVFIEYSTEKVKVYSLKSDSWGKIRDFQHNNDVFKPMAQHVNGILHWMAKDIEYDSNEEGFNLTFVIVSLNLGNETYGEIKQTFYEMSNCFDKELRVIEGCLSVFFYTKDCYDIWVMKEYGNSDTWIKLYTIPFTDIFRYFSFPLCISTTGEILLENRDELVLYNPNNGGFRHLLCDSVLFRSFSLCAATTYVESLVSPNVYEEESNT